MSAATSTKARAPKAKPTPVVIRPTGTARPRLAGWNLVIAAGAVFAAVLIVANIVVFVGRTDSQPQCPAGQISLPPAGAAGQVGQRWTSKGLKFSFEYPSVYVKVDAARDNPTDVHLAMPEYKYDPDIWIAGYPASTTSAEDAFRQRLADLKKEIPDLAQDDESYDRIPAPGLGFQRGVGASFAGHSALQQPARVAIVAVSAGRVTAFLSFRLAGAGLTSKSTQHLWSLGGSLILDTFRFS